MGQRRGDNNRRRCILIEPRKWAQVGSSASNKFPGRSLGKPVYEPGKMCQDRNLEPSPKNNSSSSSIFGGKTQPVFFSSIWLFNKFCKFEFLYNCRVSFLFRTAVVRNRLFFSKYFHFFPKSCFHLLPRKKRLFFLINYIKPNDTMMAK